MVTIPHNPSAGADAGAEMLISLAPVLCGVRPAVLYTTRFDRLPRWHSLLALVCGSGAVRCREVHRTHCAAVFLVYNPAGLVTHLSHPIAAALLHGLSYPPPAAPRRCVEHLCSRFGHGEFPHEVGLFLGYPPRDVISFIEQRGQGYLLCRYWKVYHDPLGALAKFAEIDAAHRLAGQLLYGAELPQAVRLLCTHAKSA